VDSARLLSAVRGVLQQAEPNKKILGMCGRISETQNGNINSN